MPQPNPCQKAKGSSEQPARRAPGAGRRAPPQLLGLLRRLPDQPLDLRLLLLGAPVALPLRPHLLLRLLDEVQHPLPLHPEGLRLRLKGGGDRPRVALAEAVELRRGGVGARWARGVMGGGAEAEVLCNCCISQGQRGCASEGRWAARACSLLSRRTWHCVTSSVSLSTCGGAGPKVRAQDQWHNRGAPRVRQGLQRRARPAAALAPPSRSPG